METNFSGWSGRVGNSDNRANSAQVQMNLPNRALLGKKKMRKAWNRREERETEITVKNSCEDNKDEEL